MHFSKKNLFCLTLTLLCLVLCFCTTACGGDGYVDDGKDPTVLPHNSDSVRASDVDLFFTSFQNDTQGQNVKEVKLSDTQMTLPEGWTQNEKQLTVAVGGSFCVSGAWSDGTLIVNAPDAKVHLIFDNVSISCQNGAPIYIQNALSVVITMAPGTVNTLTDGMAYALIDTQRVEPDAALCSRSDLTLNGTGTLVVNARGADAIKGKDALRLSDLRVEITTNKDGITGKDALIMRRVRGTVNSEKDGIRSTHDTDPARGYMLLSYCELDVNAKQDGIQSQTALVMAENTLNITTNGGNETLLATDAKSCKGIKAQTRLVIESGNYTFSCADDALHATDLTVNGGAITAKSGTDALQANGTLTMAGGEVNVTNAQDGITCGIFSQTGGVLNVTCADDGITARADANRPDFVPDLVIFGGQLWINAGGEPLKSEENITISGGTSYLFGNTASNNAPADAEGAFTVSGGTVVLSGNANLTTNAQGGAGQVLVRATSALAKDAAIALKDASGNVVVEVTLPRNAVTFLIVSPNLTAGATYTLYAGADVKGSANAS